MKPNIHTSILALLCAAATAHANLLIDGSFENNPLTTDTNVFSNFALYEGQWGTEGGTITTGSLGITPANGLKLLEMTGSGGTYQTMQITQVSPSDAALISGGALVNLSALFNTPNVAIAGVSVSFYSAGNSSSGLGTLFGGLTLDGNVKTWQQVTATGAIPVGTAWMLSQVTYDATSLGGNPGFVDLASLTIVAVPEPGTALFGIACVGVAALRRRRSSAV